MVFRESPDVLRLTRIASLYLAVIGFLELEIHSKLDPDAFREHKIEAYRVMSHFVNLADKNFDFETLRLDMN